jgi:fermentation-respiration switch protein FrsA (DUF1100 family)
MKTITSAVKKLVMFCVLAYCVLAAALFFGQRIIMYNPNPSVPDPGVSIVPEMQAERLRTADGMAPLAWWVPPADGTRPVVIYFHGNSGTVAQRAGRARILIDAGYGVLLAGYRYNAGGGGDPSEEGLIADARAALDFALSQGISPERIILWGESFGTGVAVILASEHAVGALVLDMPYTSMADLAQEKFWYMPARWLIRDEYDSLSRIGRVNAPLLVIHGERDTRIPVRFGRKLFDAANEPKVGHFLPEGTHGNLDALGAMQLVLDFLEQIFPAAQSGE